MRYGILFVSPHSEDANSLSEILGSLPMELHHVDDLEHARARLDHARYPVILTDASLPDGAWPDVLDLAREKSPFSRVLVTYRLADARLWLDAMSVGVYDLLNQPFEPDEVRRIFNNAFARHARAAG